MKKMLMVAAGVIAFVGVQGVGTASADTSDARITVPFTFTVHGRTLPAGKYDVHMAQDTPDVLLLQNVDQPRMRAALLTVPDYSTGISANQPSLEFVKKDGVERLADFVDPDAEGHEVLTHAGK
jgi:hypothetical protein